MIHCALYIRPHTPRREFKKQFSGCGRRRHTFPLPALLRSQTNGAVRFHYAEFMPIITVHFDRRNIIFCGIVSQWTEPIRPECKGISMLILCYRLPSETDTWATIVKSAMNVVAENITSSQRIPIESGSKSVGLQKKNFVEGAFYFSKFRFSFPFPRKFCKCINTVVMNTHAIKKTICLVWCAWRSTLLAVRVKCCTKQTPRNWNTSSTLLRNLTFSE